MQLAYPMQNSAHTKARLSEAFRKAVYTEPSAPAQRRLFV